MRRNFWFWVLNEIIQKISWKYEKKSWEPFEICLLNSTANPANFHPNWARLAVLFRRQLLNGSKDFFCFDILISIWFFKYKTIQTHARSFLPLNISAVGSVKANECNKIKWASCIHVLTTTVSVFGNFCTKIIFLVKSSKYRLVYHQNHH